MNRQANCCIVPSSGALEERADARASVYRQVEVQERPHLLEYWSVIRQRYITLLVVLFIVFTITLIVTLRQKPVYEAKTLIEIQKENPEIPSVQELFQLDSISDSYLETQDRILKSDDLARRVIADLNLSEVPEFKTSGSPASSRAVTGSAPDPDSVSNEVLKRFQQRLTVEPVKRSRLIEITFEANDPALAAKVANAVANTYIDQNLGARWQASERAAEWLSHQLADMKAALEKSQDQLQNYAKQSGLLFLESEQGNTENITVQRLRELQQDLTKAEADRYQYESVQRLLTQGDYASLPGVFDNKLMQDLTEKLADLQRERSRLAADFNPQYPKLKEIDNQISESEADLSKERERGARLIENNYKAAVDRESMLRDAFERQKVEANDVADKSVQYNIIKREVDTNKQLYVGLLEKLKETAVSTSLKASNIRIVDIAHPAAKPDRPRIPLNLSLAAMFGLCLGIACVFLQEHLDNTFKSAEEAEQFLRLPSLCSIPRVATTSRVACLTGQVCSMPEAENEKGIARRGSLESHAMDPLLAEAFHGLRTSVLLSRAKCPPTSLLLTSTQPGEGKTTVAVNLAMSLAQLGHSVLLVDADLRRPTIDKCLGRNGSSGLVDFLTGQGDWRNYVWHSPFPCLSVLASGIVPPNPADLLASEYMRTLIQDANSEYKFVVLDSPPITELADSRILATLVEGIILVVGCGTTSRDLVQRAYVSGLDQNTNVLGVAVNFTEVKYGYGYYGYTRTESGT